MSEPKVYFDACCFIDMAQASMSLPLNPGRENHVHACRSFLRAARAKPADALVYTSTVTLVECLSVTDMTDPTNHQKILNDEVQRLFKGLLQSGVSGVVSVATTPMIAEGARDLRWKHGVTTKPMDSLHIAAAMKMGCTHFITTDTLKPTDVTQLAALGLVVTSADKVATLLPSKYLQTEIPAKGMGAPSRAASPAAPSR